MRSPASARAARLCLWYRRARHPGHLAARRCTRSRSSARSTAPAIPISICGFSAGICRRSAIAPLGLLNGRIFDAQIFHPARQTLAYSDHFLPDRRRWCGRSTRSRGSIVLAYNIVLFASLVASALAMHLLARRVTGSTMGALAAGTIWGFWPYHIAHLGHLQLQATYAMPLAFLALHRLVAGVRVRDGCALRRRRPPSWRRRRSTTASSGAVGLAVSTGGADDRDRRPSRWAAAAAAGAGRVSSALCSSRPFVWPYLAGAAARRLRRNLYEASRHAATPAATSAPRP